jgi:hypothetical protein
MRTTAPTQKKTKKKTHSYTLCVHYFLSQKISFSIFPNLFLKKASRNVIFQPKFTTFAKKKKGFLLHNDLVELTC